MRRGAACPRPLQKNKMTKPSTRKQIRLKNYDYANNGYYFITIDSINRKNIFGEINNKRVGAPLACARNNIKLSTIGQIIKNQWDNIPNEYNNIELDHSVIMPNHLHGIIVINKRAQASGAPTISQIIRSFKSKSTMEYLTYIKQNNLNVSGKIWQRSFYDHIIRNEESLNKIREYIINNPAQWAEDEENPDNFDKMKTEKIYSVI